MGVYIKGMDMPTGDSMIVAIRPDGMVEDVMGCYVGKAVPLKRSARGEMGYLKISNLSLQIR